MRELYASELHGAPDTTNATAWAFIEEWGSRHGGVGRVTVEDASTGARVLTVEQSDDGDQSLMWRSEVAVGLPDDPLYVTIRVRLAATGDSVLAPLEYEFRTPAITRTLARELPLLDGGERITPWFLELGASDVPHLVAWLQAPERRLPVVVVSRTRESGGVLLDTAALARELTGIGHVRVLAASQASWALTGAIGAQLSVWDGAVRVYFPGFAPTDDPRRHRVWFPDKVGIGVITRLRSWLGSLSSSRTPEHPVFERLRIDRREKLRDAASGEEENKLLYELFDDAEQVAKQRAAEVVELQGRNAELERRFEAVTEELDDVRRSFGEVARAQRIERVPPDFERMPTAPLTVASAMDCIEQLAANRYYADRVTLTRQALAAGREFAGYQDPEGLLRAVQAVLEAGALYHDDKLGMPPMEFFNLRGFGYAAQPAPHLKVDEATSPDQCLRIHWKVDADERRWTVTHIGRHL